MPLNGFERWAISVFDQSIQRARYGAYGTIGVGLIGLSGGLLAPAIAPYLTVGAGAAVLQVLNKIVMDEPKFEFDWGVGVLVTETAPKKFNPAGIGTVVGMRSIDTADEAAADGFPITTILYTVEFADGRMVEIPGDFLRAEPK